MGSVPLDDVLVADEVDGWLDFEVEVSSVPVANVSLIERSSSSFDRASARAIVARLGVFEAALPLVFWLGNCFSRSMSKEWHL